MIVRLFQERARQEDCRAVNQQSHSNGLLQMVVREREVGKPVQDGHHHFVVGLGRELTSCLVGQVAQAGKGMDIFPAIIQSRVKLVEEGGCHNSMVFMVAANQTTSGDKAVPLDIFLEETWTSAQV